MIPKLLPYYWSSLNHRPRIPGIKSNIYPFRNSVSICFANFRGKQKIESGDGFHKSRSGRSNKDLINDWVEEREREREREIALNDKFRLKQLPPLATNTQKFALKARRPTFWAKITPLGRFNITFFIRVRMITKWAKRALHWSWSYKITFSINSLYVRWNLSIEHAVEHSPCDWEVQGSIPAGRRAFFITFTGQLLQHKKFCRTGLRTYGSNQPKRYWGEAAPLAKYEIWLVKEISRDLKRLGILVVGLL